MKKLLIFIAVFIALTSQAQDTSNSPITVILPVKAIVIYSYYLSQQPNWTDRKAPDQIQAIIGSGNAPDSLVTVTMSAGKLASFASQIIGDRYGALAILDRSVFNNSPSISGYTSLASQLNTKASGSTSQAAAAQYVINKYNQYLQTMTDLYNQMYAAGLNWIRN